LVFGKDGQLGQALACSQAVRSGMVQLILLDRSEADLANPEKCGEIINQTIADVVVNAAALTAVTDAEAQVNTAIAINGTAPGIMAAAAAARGLPFIQISTDYVFDGEGIRPWLTGDSTNPNTVYGSSKRLGEVGVMSAYENIDTPFAVLRTSWVISARGKNFASTILNAGQRNGHVSVVSDQIGGPTPADDLATAIVHIAESLVAKTASGGIYHYSGAPDVSWYDLAREIFEVAGLSVEVKDILTSDLSDRTARPLNSRLDCTTTERVFGLPRPDWRAALPTIVADLQRRTKSHATLTGAV